MSYGDGTIGHVKIGKYDYYCVRFYLDGKQKAKRFPFSQAGERAAKRFQREIQRKRITGEIEQPQQPATQITTQTSYTVASWLDSFIEKKSNLRDSSKERMIQSYAKIEVHEIGNIPLNELTASMVENFYYTLSSPWIDVNGEQQKQLSSSSISKIHRLLFAGYKKAMQNGEITANPLLLVEPPKVVTKTMSTFSWREIGKIFHAIRKHEKYKFNNSQRYNYRLLFMMLLECGMRIGELLALRWKDVDLQKREIHIHSTKGRDKQTFNAPKTKSGNRLIPILFDKLHQALAQYKEITDGKPDSFVFSNKSGGSINYQRVFLTWQRVCELAGIEEKGLHTFRHTCATYLLQHFVPVAEVSRILGHSSPTITYSFYVHAIPNYNEKLIQQFSKKTSTK